jgi:phenylpropionate dioxygenase-like ring-hydroxylating dioxygenase large terminal subunit
VNRESDIELCRRFFASRAERTDDLSDDVWRVPVAEYTSAEHLAREEQLLFRARPVVACLTADVPSPGDYVSFVCAGLPILVVRGDDGAVRAFVNTCRHRGARVAPDDRGHARRCLVCPYHSWTYELDGALRSQPGSVGGFAALDRADLGLRPLAAAEGHGLVFVRPGGAEPIDLDGLLAGAEADLDAFGLAGYHHVETRRTVRAMNWKLVIDTFLEAYHIFSLHRQSIAPDYFSTPALFDAFGPNSRYVGVRRSITTLEGQPESEWSILPHATMHFVLVPNTLLVHQIDHFELWRAFPLGVDRVEIHTGLYAPQPPMEEKAQRYWRKNLDAVQAVTGTEDFPQCEQMQADMAAGAVPELIFGRNEPALGHYHRSLRELLGEPARRTPT